jgi:hypothetical protein
MTGAPLLLSRSRSARLAICSIGSPFTRCFALLQLSVGHFSSELMVHATRGTEETDVSLLQ